MFSIARQRVARGVGVNGGHAAVMAGVHRLQHVECLGAADLADDDPVRTHAQRVAHQVALGHLTLALQTGWPCLQANDMRLLQLQFGRVLHRHHAFPRHRSAATGRSSAWSCPTRCHRK